jgi:hypothetical protein
MKKLVSYYFSKRDKEDDFTMFIDELKKINRKIRNINYGGCGVMAVMIYDKLKLLGYKPKICVMVYNIANFSKSMDMYYKHGLEYYVDNRTEGLPHIVVKANGYYIDSSGAYSNYHEINSMAEYLYEDVDVEFIRECCDVVDIWNNVFDRNKISIIQKNMDKIYNQITKKDLVI